jgi:hypothetical protein
MEEGARGREVMIQLLRGRMVEGETALPRMKTLRVDMKGLDRLLEGRVRRLVCRAEGRHRMSRDRQRRQGVLMGAATLLLSVTVLFLKGLLLLRLALAARGMTDLHSHCGHCIQALRSTLDRTHSHHSTDRAHRTHSRSGCVRRTRLLRRKIHKVSHGRRYDHCLAEPGSAFASHYVRCLLFLQ